VERRPDGGRQAHVARELVRRARTCVHAAGLQARTQQVLAGTDVQRQTAVVPVVPLDEAPLLHPMDRIIGRVEIARDLRWGSRVARAEQVHEAAIDRVRVDGDLRVPRHCGKGRRQGRGQPVQAIRVN